MPAKKVFDIYNRVPVAIDTTTKQLYAFNNELNTAIYTAKEVGQNYHPQFVERHPITTVAEKIQTWKNPFKLWYAVHVQFNADQYDPDRSFKNQCIQIMEQNPHVFFNQFGDWRPLTSRQLTHLFQPAIQ